MAIRKNMKRTVGTSLTKMAGAVGRTSRSKAPGTRLGIFLDWREGSARSGRASGRCGSVVRDGR